MRYLLVTAALLCSLSLPFAAIADEDEDDEALAEFLMSSEGLPQADFGQRDEHGWFLQKKDGVCTMSSFNDSLELQVDPANPDKTVLKFQLFDGEMPEADGAQLPVLLGVRGQANGDYAVHGVYVTVSKSAIPPAYVLPTPIDKLVSDYPNGFQLMLKDQTAETTLARSSTLGSGKHLAALVACRQ